MQIFCRELREANQLETTLLCLTFSLVGLMENNIFQFSLLRKLKIIDTEAFPWADCGASIMGKTTMILFNVHIPSSLPGLSSQPTLLL